MSRLSAIANDLLNASTSAIWLVSGGDELTLVASEGGYQHAQKIPLRESFTGQAVLLKKPVTTDDARSAPLFYRHDLAESQNWTRALVAPLFGDNGQALGAFSVFSAGADEGRFAESEWDQKVLSCLAHYAALAAQNESHQQALRAAQERHAIAETFAAVGDVASNLLHNMNNKIGAIPARVQTIQDKYRAALQADDYLAKKLDEIEACAMEAMQIAQENLSYLRPIRLEQTLVEPRIAEAIRAMQAPPSVKFVYEGLENLPKIIAGNQSLVFVFKNLIENAIEAMRGEGEIAIRGASDAEWVEVAVCDSGPGISPELHDRIFELNFSARAGAHVGKIGFGLWWVKTLMTRLGGTIAVESDGQHGATFRLRLPRAS
jgi:signal transduction histidine kinase